jgi:predicted transcriptional regulator
MLAVSILLLSSTVAVNLLLEDSPVVIQLEGDTFKVVDIPYVYTVKEAYILLFSGFFGGLALAQVLRALGVQGSAFPVTGQAAQVTALDVITEKAPEKIIEVSLENTPTEEPRPSTNIDPTDVLLRALEGDERKAIELIAAKGGRILQNELVNSLDFSKAKVSRVLMNLERRGIITKKKYGLTNCISISDELKDDFGMRGEIE